MDEMATRVFHVTKRETQSEAQGKADQISSGKVCSEDLRGKEKQKKVENCCGRRVILL